MINQIESKIIATTTQSKENDHTEPLYRMQVTYFMLRKEGHFCPSSTKYLVWDLRQKALLTFRYVNLRSILSQFYLG